MAKVDSTITVVLNEEARELIKLNNPRLIQCAATDCKHHSAYDPVTWAAGLRYNTNEFQCTLREIFIVTGGGCGKYEQN
jgi:hypothetical protein